eukprot:TRINITY_DN104122_c0_g1_i1.p1 TRINITY_DN104122_c0_g1~~TRINITY_DN104122_c0_g1_i1.p1  ORF type:complete len:429 (+),score=85.95 TRINITY_DN104122_c0_g1_i1:175-1461(+)
MRVRRTNWTEPGVAEGLLWLAIDDRKGNARRTASLPPNIYSDCIAPFLHFDAPLPNQLYVVGGRNHQYGPLDTVEMFDTWHGRWVTCPAMSVRRAGCAAAVLPDGRMLVVGGYDENGIVKGLLASCEAFDARSQTWSRKIAPLERARWGHGCASLGDLVYAVGGCSLRLGAPSREACMETLRSCEAYDMAANVWRPCADLLMARAGSRVVPIRDQYLAAVGGCDDVFGRAEMLPTVELFDADAGHWTLLETQLSTPRTTAAVAALDDGTVLVVGGAPSLASVEAFRAGPPGCASAQLQVSAHTPQGRSVQDDAEGGVGCQVRDLPEGRMGCQAVALQLPKKGESYPLCNATCVAVVGGENGDEDWDEDQAHVRQFNTVLVYDAEEGEWRPDTFFPAMFTPRTAMALCVAQGRIRGYPHLTRASFKGGG